MNTITSYLLSFANYLRVKKHGYIFRSNTYSKLENITN